MSPIQIEAATGYVIVVSLMVTGAVTIWATGVFFGIVRDVVRGCLKYLRARRMRKIEHNAWGR